LLKKFYTSLKHKQKSLSQNLCKTSLNSATDNPLTFVSEEQVGFIRVRDSNTFHQFGMQQMSQPGPRAKLDRREFLDMKPQEVLTRKKEVGKVGTLHGIKSKFHYICLPNGKVKIKRWNKAGQSNIDIGRILGVMEFFNDT
jgi:hypothetical protein